MTWGIQFKSKEEPTAPDPQPLPKLPAWSYSRYAKWQKCPRSAFYAFVARRPEPQSPEMARGITAHNEAARILTGEECNPMILTRQWVDRLSQIKGMFGDNIEAELQQGFTKDWEPTGWFAKDVWCRVVFDGFAVLPTNNAAIHVYEHKTGKVRAEHIAQVGLYAVAAQAALPESGDRDVVVTLNYLDVPPDSTMSMQTYVIRAKEIPTLRGMWNDRIAPMMNDTEFPATPGTHCKWCAFSKNNGGDCDRG